MRGTPPTDQRAQVRPISFALATTFDVGAPITLPVRPEDLTRNEPQRVTVNQTLGRGVQGWVDNFGEGMPSVTISGHTGWRYQAGSKQDGFQSFEALNDLVIHKYATEKQKAIDDGIDPATVKLLFADTLDGFAWSVAPMQFVLRRSKSRPLLYQYNITLQAVDTNIDGGLNTYFPFLGTVPGGLSALDRGIWEFTNITSRSIGDIQTVFGHDAPSVLGFVNLASSALLKAQSVINGVNGVINGTAGAIIGIVKSFSMVGRQLFRTVAGIVGIGTNAKMAFARIAAAFNEFVCIFSNALRPRSIYEDYTPLYGASNCSSTTGGRMPSAFSDANVFALLNPRSSMPITLGGAALQSVSAIVNSDPVLAPMSIAEAGRHLSNIVAGTVIS